MKKYLSFILLACLTLATTLANASHFRGGAVNASVNSTGLVTLAQTSFWANNDGNDFGFGVLNQVSWSGGSGPVGGISNHSNSIDTSDARFDVGSGSAQFQLPGAGVYTYNVMGYSPAELAGAKPCKINGAFRVISSHGTSTSVAGSNSTV